MRALAMLRCRPDGGCDVACRPLPRPRVRCCDVAQGGCDVARPSRARENVAGMGAPHRTTSQHRTCDVACDIAQGRGDVATSPLRLRRPCDIADCLGDIATSHQSRGRPQGGGDHRRFSENRSASPHEQHRERHRVRPARCRNIAPDAGAILRCRPGRVRCRTVASGPSERRGGGSATSHDIATSHGKSASDIAQGLRDVACDVGRGDMRRRTLAEPHRTSPKRYPHHDYEHCSMTRSMLGGPARRR